MAKRHADPRPDPGAPTSIDPNDRENPPTVDTGDDDEGRDDDDDDAEDHGARLDVVDERLGQHEEVGLGIDARLSHVEDVLHGLLLQQGEMYVGAGAHRAKLKETIDARELVAGT